MENRQKPGYPGQRRPSQRSPNPRQHWGERAKKNQPRAVGFLNDGGDEEDRTPDLRIANATLSQLSYVPISCRYYSWRGKKW